MTQSCTTGQTRWFKHYSNNDERSDATNWPSGGLEGEKDATVSVSSLP
jgi:hypothetical protein